MKNKVLFYCITFFLTQHDTSKCLYTAGRKSVNGLSLFLRLYVDISIICLLQKQIKKKMLKVLRYY